MMLLRWPAVVVMAWAACQLGLTMVTWEVHMDVHVAIEVRGEARGAVGPGRVR